MIIRKNYLFNKLTFYFSAFLILIAILFVPYNLVISKDRTFQVVDKNLNPLAGSAVRQEWIQYSLDLREEDLRFSDQNGFVFLPERRVRTSIIELLNGAYEKLKKYGLNASFTSHDIIHIQSNGYESCVIFDGQGIENGKVVMERKKPR